LLQESQAGRGEESALDNRLAANFLPDFPKIVAEAKEFPNALSGSALEKNLVALLVKNNRIALDYPRFQLVFAITFLLPVEDLPGVEAKGQVAGPIGVVHEINSTNGI
jgi:hypothetical protein